MKMSKLTFAALLLIASLPLALAQGTYTQIDVPGAVGTSVLGINAAGDLVGDYGASGGIGSHGFLLSGGVYSTIDYPGATYTYLRGLNDLGQIVGYALFSSNSYVGFEYDVQTQTFTEISYPHGSTTWAFCINNAGVIAGQFQHNNVKQGFELIGSTYTEIRPPGSVGSAVYGISGAGELVGNATLTHGGNFSFYQGKYQLLTIPNARNAVVENINNSGTAIVGIYEPSGGFIAGFLYQNGGLQGLRFPMSRWTDAIGVNDSGVVVGTFADASNNSHGFLWTPPADAAKK